MIQMTIMVTLEFPMQDNKQSGFLELLGNALTDTRAYDGCIKVETFAEADRSSVLLVEYWESREHQETYFQWRIDTGLVDLIGPFISGPPVTKYYDIRSE